MTINRPSTLRITVTLGSVAEKSIRDLAGALIDKRWSVQRGVSTGSNSLYVSDAEWNVLAHDKGLIEAAMQRAMSDAQAVIDAARPKALDSYGIRISAQTSPLY